MYGNSKWCVFDSLISPRAKYWVVVSCTSFDLNSKDAVIFNKAMGYNKMNKQAILETKFDE